MTSPLRESEGLDQPPRFGVKKISAAALDDAFDLLRSLMGPDRTLLGAEPGAVVVETISGHRLVAHRLRDGGIEVRETAR